jgi:hypothetical protein
MVTVYATCEDRTITPACSDRAMAERTAFDLLHQGWTDITIEGAPFEPDWGSGNKGQLPS